MHGAFPLTHFLEQHLVWSTQLPNTVFRCGSTLHTHARSTKQQYVNINLNCWMTEPHTTAVLPIASALCREYNKIIDYLQRFIHADVIHLEMNKLRSRQPPIAAIMVKILHTVATSNSKQSLVNYGQTSTGYEPVKVDVPNPNRTKHCFRV